MRRHILFRPVHPFEEQVDILPRLLVGHNAVGQAALDDGLVEAALDARADQHIGDRRAARGLACNGDALRIAAEYLHVVMDPVERQDLIA